MLARGTSLQVGGCPCPLGRLTFQFFVFSQDELKVKHSVQRNRLSMWLHGGMRVCVSATQGLRSVAELVAELEQAWGPCGLQAACGS